MSRMNRETYEKMIAENIAWLREQPLSLERDHIEAIVRRSADLEYTSAVDALATLCAELADEKRFSAELHEAKKESDASFALLTARNESMAQVVWHARQLVKFLKTWGPNYVDGEDGVPVVSRDGNIMPAEMRHLIEDLAELDALMNPKVNE